jgi:multidrug resistance efflux pump
MMGSDLEQALRQAEAKLLDLQAQLAVIQFQLGQAQQAVLVLTGGK